MWRKIYSIALFPAILALAAACTPRAATTTQTESSPAQITEPTIRVCIDDDVKESTLSFRGKYVLQLQEANYILDESVGDLKLIAEDDRLVLRNDRRNFVLPAGKKVHFDPENDAARFVWDDQAYRGELLLHVEADEKYAVNRLPIEAYLDGVVTHEIPSYQADYREAVLAQAIASRSYALFRLKKPQDTYFDIHDDTRDQVYRGDAEASVLAREAVSVTSGMMLSRSDLPAQASYHSTCGGVLEIDSDSIKLADGSYGSELRDLAENEYNCKVSPHYRWVETIEADVILQNLHALKKIDNTEYYTLLNGGYELNIEILKRSPSGRVETLEVQVGDRPIIVRSLEIRRVLANAAGKIAASNYFFLNRSPGEEEKMYIVGAGAGHGRGMCQWGAVGMSLKGYTHQNILGFYYPELTLYKYY